LDKEIKGVSCEVTNCIYHDKTNNCNAGHIKVGNPRALHESETKCETFECCDEPCDCE
jgi:hypothetical protein